MTKWEERKKDETNEITVMALSVRMYRLDSVNVEFNWLAAYVNTHGATLKIRDVYTGRFLSIAKPAYRHGDNIFISWFTRCNVSFLSHAMEYWKTTEFMCNLQAAHRTHSGTDQCRGKTKPFFFVAKHVYIGHYYYYHYWYDATICLCCENRWCIESCWCLIIRNKRRPKSIGWFGLESLIARIANHGSWFVHSKGHRRRWEIKTKTACNSFAWQFLIVFQTSSH